MAQEVVVAPPMGVPPPTSLAPGFRFHPTDEELVRYYLRRKVCGKPFRFQAVTEIDVYKSEPWELAGYSSLKTRDLEWYFFSPVDRKYGNGSRLNRATGQGYWKATGKDRSVLHKNLNIGMKKTLVFHSGRAPDGQRTNWVMHEYRLCDPELGSAGISQDAFVLCRIFQKSGLGPPNGDRYAPFLEEEWNEDTPIIIPGGEVDDDAGNGGNEARVEGTNLDQDMPTLSIVPFQIENNQTGSASHPSMCKRELSEDTEPNSSAQESSKRAKNDVPNCSNANGSEDSTTTSQNPTPPIMMMTKNVPVSVAPKLLEFPLVEPKESQPAKPTMFDSSNLETSVPPGYLKFISNLENEILNMSMEKETLKIEMMRAQAMINILQSRVEFLSRENDELKRSG